MLYPNDFKIYNASAGTGKTYTLVQEIMLLLLGKEDRLAFGQILAMTFTNKAANEMKQRIMEKLQELSKGEISPEELALIKQELGKDKGQIKKKAAQVLSEILHNYALFSVSTIDTFNLRLMKAFSHDLGLDSNFEVEMNTTEMLDASIDMLYSGLKQGDTLTNMIADIAVKNLQIDKSWDVSINMAKESKDLYNDSFLPHMAELNKLTLEQHNAFRKRVFQHLSSGQKKAKKYSQAALELLKEKGIAATDLSKGARGIYSFFNKIAVQSKYDYPTKTHVDIIEERKYASAKGKNKEADIAAIFDELAEYYHQIVPLLPSIEIWSKIQKTTNTITLFSEVEKMLTELKSENRIILISEFNQIIGKHIKEQPIPFIYEKIGTRYHHYFIDEFQDTSTLQWENIFPLVESAISQGDTVMIVGDPKQSIYRFKGGDVQLMIDLIRQEKQNEQISVVNLDKNWRSYDQIIQFNNAFYTFISQQIEDEDFKNIYLLGNDQKTNTKEGGFVHLELLEKDKEEKYEDKALERLLDTVKDCENQGFSLSDMAILTRGKKELSKVAEFLSEQGIEVISNESLLLKNSEEVQLLLTFINLLTDWDNASYRANLVLSLHQRQSLLVEDVTSFILEIKEVKQKEFIQKLKQKGIDLSFAMQPMFSFYDLMERAAKNLQLDKKAWAYVSNFLDEILNFQNKNEYAPAEFLKYWEVYGENKSIATPAGTTAVNLMTMHKSKGLQFPVVLLPFATFTYSIHKNGVWIPVEDEEMKTYYIQGQSSDKVVHLSQEIQDIMKKEEQALFMDELNLLYVATTRAVEQLYVFSEKDDKQTRLITRLVNQFMENNGNQNVLEWGKKTQKKKKEKESSWSVVKNVGEEWTQKIKVSNEHALLWGNRETAIEYGKKVHAVLEKIEHKDQVDSVLQEYKNQGFITGEESLMIKIEIDKILQHPLLKGTFEAQQVLNERDFVSPSGRLFRPDRLVKLGDEWILLDYKTGETKKKDISQVTQYAEDLNALGFNVTKKYLIYFGSEVVEV